MDCFDCCHKLASFETVIEPTQLQAEPRQGSGVGFSSFWVLIFHLQIFVFANFAERHSVGKQEIPRGMLCTMARRQATKVIAQDFPAGSSTAESSKDEGETKPKSQGPAADLPSSLQEAGGRLPSSRKPETRGSEDAELHGSAKETPGGEKAARESHSETQENSSAREEAAAIKRSAKSLEGASEGSKLQHRSLHVLRTMAFIAYDFPDVLLPLA